MHAAAVAKGLNWGALISALTGLLIGVIIGFTTVIYGITSRFGGLRKFPVPALADIITGFSYGLISIAPAMLGIVAATITSYFVSSFGLPGIYGIGVAVGMLSLTGIIVSNDAYGPIVDNAKGIAEMSGMPHDVVERADTLDSAGNTAKAITKGFSISAAALTVLAMFAAYCESITQYSGKDLQLDLMDPLVLSGVLLGCIIPALFSAELMLAVTKNAFTMIEEIRRQFKAEPGILKGTVLPDYTQCVAIASSGALKSLIGPAFLAIVCPLLVGFILGPGALGGFLGGSIFTGVVFALLMSNAGGCGTMVKIHRGRKLRRLRLGSPQAAVSAILSATPSKTRCPSLNTLITVMSWSPAFAPLIARYHIFG